MRKNRLYFGLVQRFWIGRKAYNYLEYSIIIVVGSVFVGLYIEIYYKVL
jgi:hypothetical protein